MSVRAITALGAARYFAWSANPAGPRPASPSTRAYILALNAGLVTADKRASGGCAPTVTDKGREAIADDIRSSAWALRDSAVKFRNGRTLPELTGSETRLMIANMFERMADAADDGTDPIYCGLGC